MPLYGQYSSNYNLLYPASEISSSTSIERKTKTVDAILALQDGFHESGVVISEGTYTGIWGAGASTVTLSALTAGIPYNGRNLLVVATNIQWTALPDNTTNWLYATVVPTSITQLYSVTVTAAKDTGSSEPACPPNSILLAKAVTTGATITLYTKEIELGTGTNKKWLYTMWAHRTAATLDHPDLSVTDAKLATGIDPAKIDDYSTDLAEMRTTVDPYPGTTPAASQAADLIGEIARLRYVLAQLTGEPYWYVDPDTNMATVAFHLTDTSDPHGAAMSVSTKVQTPEIENAGGSVTLDGGIICKRVSTATDYNTTINDYIIGVTDTSVARAVQLMTATLTVGRVVIVKDESGVAGANNITISTEGAAKIDGEDTLVISTNHGAATLYCDGADWQVI